MADELKVVVKAEVELDKKQTEAEIEAQSKKLKPTPVQIEGKLDTKSTRKNLNEAIKNLKLNKANVQLKLDKSSVSSIKAQVQKQLTGLAVKVNWDKGNLAGGNPSGVFEEANKAAKQAATEVDNFANKVAMAEAKLSTRNQKNNALAESLNAAGLAEEAQKVEKAYKKVENTLDQFKRSGSKEAWNDLTAATVEHTEASKQASMALSDNTDELKKQAAAAKAAQKAEQGLIQLSKMQSEWSKAFRNPDNVSRASEIKGLLSSQDIENVNKGLSQLKLFKMELQATGQATQTLSNKTKELFKQFTSWYSISHLTMDAIQGMKRIGDEVHNIDASMEELEKVTTSTQAGYDQFLEDAGKKAKDLSTSITSVIDATAGWSRLGYGLKDADVLGEWSTIYENVGDNIDSAETATKHLVSITKAFGTEGQSMVGMVESVVDRLNAVGNKTSISSGEIGTALQNSASALNNANNSLSESIALVVGAYDITQDASETGNMWKTVSMRLRGAKADLESMGEDTEGMVESTSKLRSQVKALTGGFDIMKDNNTFKSTYDMIIGIGEAYQKMTDSSRASLLELIAGKNRGNAVAAALNNIEAIKNAYEIAENAEGSAMKEYDTYLNHIESHRQKLQASFQAFSTAVLDTDLVKGGYDVGSGTLDFFTSLINMLGSIPTLATAATAALSLLHNKGISNEKYAPSKKNSLAAETRICWELDYKTNTLQRSWQRQTRMYSESTWGQGTRKAVCWAYGESLSAKCA